MLALLALSSHPGVAQCNCNQPDPFGYIANTCSLPTLNVNGRTNTCLASSCDINQAVQYDVYFPSNTCTGYYWQVNGGVVVNEVVTYGTSQVTIPVSCQTTGQAGSVNYLNHATLYIDWTTESETSPTSTTTNTLTVWGYTGMVNGYPSTCSYYTCLPVNTGTPITTPITYISLSSPICSLPGWYIFPSWVGNATEYTWSYNGGPYLGGTMGDWPNATHPYNTGPAIPNPYSYGVTANFCVYAKNACSSGTPYCGSIVIPSTSTACSGGCSWCSSASPETGTTIARNLSLSPNPASNLLHVAFDRTADHAVELISTVGVVSKKAIAPASTHIDIDVSTLAKGLYFVILYENGGLLSRRTVLIR